MDRRSVLAAATGVASAALAGCTGGSGGSGGGETAVSETPTGSATTSADGAFPRITNRSFERTGDADEQTESASVAFDDDLVTVTGVIRGKNGCMEASLETAEYDREANELRVRVTTVREGGDACTQQIVYRGYETTVEFAGGLPATVVVEHESMGEVRTVGDVTR